MCKQNESKQTFWEPNQGMMDTLNETTNAIRSLNETVTKLCECFARFMEAEGPKRPEPRKNIDRETKPCELFTKEDRAIFYGKDGKLFRLELRLTPKTVKELGVEEGMKGRVRSHDSFDVSSTSKGVSSWQVRRDGSAVLDCRRDLDLNVNYKFAIFSLVKGEEEGKLQPGELLYTSQSDNL